MNHMNQLPVEVVPSFPAPSWEALEAALVCLQGVAPQFQIDIVDGQFVTATAWPFTESFVPAEFDRLRAWSTIFALEVDCMVTEPEQYLDTLVAAGVKRLVVHYGSTTQLPQIVAHATAHGYQLGLAFTNDVFCTQQTAIEAMVPAVSFVQVMGIKTVGAQGQPFDERTVTTVHTLRKAFPGLPIAVDGSVNADTIPGLLAAGANRLAPGSAIIATPHPAAAYTALVSLASR